MNLHATVYQLDPRFARMHPSNIPQERCSDSPTNVEGGCEPELSALAQVIEPHAGPQGTALCESGRDAVSRSADFCGEQLSGQQEGGAIGPKLAPEGGEKVHLRRIYNTITMQYYTILYYTI